MCEMRNSEAMMSMLVAVAALLMITEIEYSSADMLPTCQPVRHDEQLVMTRGHADHVWLR